MKAISRMLEWDAMKWIIKDIPGKRSKDEE